MKLVVRDPQRGGMALDARGVEASDVARLEPWAKDLIWCDLEAWAIQDDGSLILTDECGNFAYAPEGRFEVEVLP